MPGTDILYDALTYTLDQIGGAQMPVSVINATGQEAADFVKISDNACYKLENTLNGVFNTLLVRATRQTDETLGLIARAARHAAPGARILVAQENAHGAPGLEKTLRRAWGDMRSVSKFKCRTMVLDAGAADPATLQRWEEKAAIRKIVSAGAAVSGAAVSGAAASGAAASGAAAAGTGAAGTRATGTGATGAERGDVWSCPGLFSWDRADPASRLLLAHLPESMPGLVADLGCGNGFLSVALARKPGVTALYGIDADARAVECCRRNLADRNVGIETHVLWRDATAPMGDLPGMDYIVTNPPFHTQQEEDRQLGQKFCNAALKMLRRGGTLYLVANRHMPYEAVLADKAAKVELLADTGGFKIIRATAR